MKVGTDAVLLGAWLPVPENCSAMLEIGSGCGVISLMLAQRTKAMITGIDLDEKSVHEAQRNAESSPWKDRVQFHHEDVQHFVQKITQNVQKTPQQFDVIVCNPPFFENSLKSPEKSRNISRHNDTLSFEELIAAVEILLSENGRLGIILPADLNEKFEKLALEKKLFATKKRWIFPTPSKKANRILMMFERKSVVCEEDNLTIRDGAYTVGYYELVRNYLKIKNQYNESV
jgi:tRNA1Val (adenine37-N6)-methyltransferase